MLRRLPNLPKKLAIKNDERSAVLSREGRIRRKIRDDDVSCSRGAAKSSLCSRIVARTGARSASFARSSRSANLDLHLARPQVRIPLVSSLVESALAGFRGPVRRIFRARPHRTPFRFLAIPLSTRFFSPPRARERTTSLASTVGETRC